MKRMSDESIKKVNDPRMLDLEQFKRILNHSYDELFVINRQGVVVYVNEPSVRNYGLAPDEIIGKTIYDLQKDGYYYPLVAPVVLQGKKTTTFEQETIVGKNCS